MSDSPLRVLFAGVSTRAAAASAARAGFAVTALDAFADLDQHPGVHALSLPHDFRVAYSAARAARVARDIPCDAVAYLSNFENHPGAVSRLTGARALWGNPAAVLRQVRHPGVVAAALQRRGIPALRVRLRGPSDESKATSADDDESRRIRWMVKPIRSGGGHHVRLLEPVGQRLTSSATSPRVPRGCYLQEFADGIPGSVVFVAAAGRVVVLGMSRQLIGDPGFGAAGFRYCGSILGAAGDPQFAQDEQLLAGASRLALIAAEEFGLSGVNAIDFIAREGTAHVVEINPRWSASMDLVERAYGWSVFGAHAAACTTGELPAVDVITARRTATALGKAIVFARRDVTIGQTRAWLDDETIGDIPRPGECIAAGRPICTVYAAGADSAACETALRLRAERVHEALANNR